MIVTEVLAEVPRRSCGRTGAGVRASTHACDAGSLVLAVLRIVAAVYDKMMRPVEEAGLSDWRAELLGAASGKVLEIGAGTGRNFGYYPSRIDRLVVSEPDRNMRALLSRASVGRGAVEVIDAPAEQLPFADETFDTVVSTLVLCSVADQRASLGEMYRVLRPGGSLLFIEHVAASASSRPRRLTWQRRIEPVWRRLVGNCHLTRRTEEAIEAAGFEIVEIERTSMRKALPLLRPTVRGVARRPPGP